MDVLVYGLGAGGVAVALVAAGWMTMQRIQVDIFMVQMLKLLAAGNPDRARKLSSAASSTPFGRVAAAIMDAHARTPADLGAGLAADSMRDAFASSRDVEMARVRRLGWLALLGAATAAGSMAVAASAGQEGVWMFGPGPVAAGLALWTWRAIARTGKEIAHHGPRLIEAMTTR